MYHAELLIVSLEFIEEHIREDVKTEDIARACHCSRSTLEKLFRCVNGISVHDYLIRRRIMKAARQIAERPDETILSIALEYGYCTHESFTRAFRSVWNCNPSEFRKKRFAELYPRLLTPLENGDDYMKKRKHVDISQLYDLFQERRDCCFVCFDIRQLDPIIQERRGVLAARRASCIA